MAYAGKTTVSVAKTKAEIEELIAKAGANQFVSGYSQNIALIGFTLDRRQIRFALPLPDKMETRFWYTPERKNKRSKEQAISAWEQECRSKWRALFLIIKAKLEAVESGISTVEREFFYDIVLPSGVTVGQYMAPQIQNAYESGTMPPMLPDFTGEEETHHV